VICSVGTKLRTISGLTDTKDVDERTNQFIKDVVERTDNGKRTSALTEKQLKWIDDIYEKHFG
jgi:uncharacterized protein YecT (DUF1311 family)